MLLRPLYALPLLCQPSAAAPVARNIVPIILVRGLEASRQKLQAAIEKCTQAPLSHAAEYEVDAFGNPVRN